MLAGQSSRNSLNSLSDSNKSPEPEDFEIAEGTISPDDIIRSKSKSKESFKAVGAFLEKKNLNKLQDINVSTLKSLKIMDSDATETAKYNSELIKSLEHELRQVSADLASSIKREMDLELMLDKFATTDDRLGAVDDKISSDSPEVYSYRSQFYASRLQVLEKKLRAEQQEKAQLRIDFLSQLDMERQKRQEAEDKVRMLQSRSKVIRIHSL